MREIKYKVWDKKREKWIHDLEYVFIDEEGEVYIIEEGTWAYQSYMDKECITDDVVVVFYTGLKDKNGKEIYEGDIIKREFEIGTPIYDEVTLGFVDYEIDKSGYFIGKVHYRPSEGFILNSCSKFDIDGEFIDKKSGVKIYSDYAEVIGNIYENPELLEGETNE